MATIPQNKPLIGLVLVEHRSFRWAFSTKEKCEEWLASVYPDVTIERFRNNGPAFEAHLYSGAKLFGNIRLVAYMG